MKSSILELPSGTVTQTDLKGAFRRALLKYHPDKGDKGGTRDQYNQVVAEYDRLSLEIGKEVDLKTTSGVSLLDLGLGLGPTTNGRICEHCGGNGYTTREQPPHRTCSECDGEGSVNLALRCKDCDNGKFTLRSGRVVECRRCYGTGRFEHPWKRVVCKKCAGMPRTLGDKFVEGRIDYVFCDYCSGTGEIELNNPVIIKGSIG